MLVSALSSFVQYHAGGSQVWERQALLRSRPIAGGGRLGEGFVAQRRAILAQPVPGDFGAEIHRIRLRMERELAHETGQRHDFKTGRGGILDVESVVQYLQLRHGRAHPELFDVDTIAAHLGRLARLDLLAPDHAETLQRGWAFLHRLSSRLRIVENRSISDLDEERGDLDGLARRLGYTSPQRAGGARRALLEDYRRFAADIRAVYVQVLGVAA
jgi:glutamate-ammonia-ligase adenylyltransferase